ncbi:MAG: ABC transporter [Trebouxia sp. A1-2]|nr:MAG: ABC transporter [Trebouxia sp. A1-2]
MDDEKKPLRSPAMQIAVSRTPVENPDRSLLRVFPKWLKVAKLWFQREDKRKAQAFAFAAVLLAAATTYLLLRISYAQAAFQTTMSKRDEEGFMKAVKRFVLIIVMACPLFATADWVEQRLTLEWRNWLTSYLLRAYFADRAFFKLKQQAGSLDNPDQRICDDVPAFTDASTKLIMSAVRQLLNCIVFAGLLWTVTPKLVWFLFVYAGVGTYVTTSAFGKRLMQLHFATVQREGDLRFDMVRTRENAESIAFYNGEVREVGVASRCLQNLVAIARLRINWSACLSLWTNCYSYATILAPAFITAPMYFRGEIEFGIISQAGNSLLIVGPSGCGKSSMLRAIAGLWTIGNGEIECPPAEDMFFLPQQPFMPLGTLRQQLLFPSGEGSAWSMRTHPPTDADLRSLLDRVQLPDLADTVGGLDTELEWSHVLSLGEQQRLAFLRLLLHEPALAFLDEATGALDSATEASCYKALQKHSTSFVSVGHRMQLLDYHTDVLHHVGNGQWQHHTSEQFKRQLSLQNSAGDLFS